MFLRLFFACYFLLGVAHAQEVPEYDRSAYGGWIDEDRDGADLGVPPHRVCFFRS